MTSSTEQEERPEPVAMRTDEAFWAAGTGRLSVSDNRAGKNSLNVEGRMVVSPIQGFGKMWQKTYRIRLFGAETTPTGVIQEWKANFPRFWPSGNRFYGPITGIAPGEVGLISLSLPGKVRLSTGVLVLYADDESFTLMTPQGHVFAGWITFRAFEESGTIVAEAQVLMRANDPVYELGLLLGGHRQEDKFWQHTLTQVAAHFGVTGEVETRTVCIDTRRQWRKAGNIWHNASIRTALYEMMLPPRIVYRSVRKIVGARPQKRG
jgi:hypothetical protein